jgi:hypothetical protein
VARQPTLTINVNQQQFQQFARNFGQFAAQIKQLNQQFGQINQSLQKTNTLTKTLQNTMQGLLNVTKSVASQVAGITGHFLKWSAIIGGVTALLGMGGGLFGIERLAASILAKRRLILGLGGDYGRTQAQMIYQQALIGSPQDVLRNIRLGLSGSPEQLTPLLTMGIPFGTKMTPDEVMDKIVAKLPDLLKRGGPGKELMMAKAFGLDKIFTDPLDMLRLSTEEGRKEYQERRKLVEQYKEQLKITPRAQKAWVELELQFQAAKAQLESVFGEKLADLAAPLKRLSEGFTHLVQILMRSPVIQELIKKLAGWIDELAKKFQSLTEKDIEAFMQYLEGWGPILKEFKENMEKFASFLGWVVDAIAKIWGFLRGNPTLSGIIGGAATGAAVGGLLGGPAGAAFGAVGGGIAGAAATTLGGGAPTPTAPGAPVPATPPTPTQGPGGIVPAVPFMNMPTFTPPGVNAPPASFGERFGQWPGGGATPAAVPRGGINWLSPQAITQMTPPSIGPKGNIGGGFFAFTPKTMGGRPGEWGGAARARLPRGYTGSRTVPYGPSTEKFEKEKPGPLSLNNWQSTRTASLVVRNVPGSNVFLSAAGMTG